MHRSSILRALALALLFTASNQASAQSSAQPIGYELRGEVVAAVQLIRQRKLSQAQDTLPKVCASFESKFLPGKKYIVADTAESLNAYKRTTSGEFEAVDFSYALCLQSLLYLHSEQGTLAEAQPLIEKIVVAVPTIAMPHVEIGFLLNKQGLYEESLLAYQRAHKIALQYPPQSAALARAWRGIGANRIDQDRLDEAQTAYQTSLEIEPENPIAVKQLEYIKGRRR